MARWISELVGPILQTAAGELNSFLASAGQADSDELLDGLDIGYDAVLFFGLTVEKRTEVADGLSLLPFKQVQAFINESLVEELAPTGAGYHVLIAWICPPVHWIQRIFQITLLDMEHQSLSLSPAPAPV